MDLFGNKEQDARMDAIESHIRAISESVRESQLDIMKLTISLIRIDSALGSKVSEDDVDPAIAALNEQLGVARVEYEKMAAAAEDSWNSLHDGATGAMETLRASVEEASARIEQEVRD